MTALDPAMVVDPPISRHPTATNTTERRKSLFQSIRSLFRIAARKGPATNPHASVKPLNRSKQHLFSPSSSSSSFSSSTISRVLQFFTQGRRQSKQTDSRRRESASTFASETSAETRYSVGGGSAVGDDHQPASPSSRDGDQRAPRSPSLSPSPSPSPSPTPVDHSHHNLQDLFHRHHVANMFCADCDQPFPTHVHLALGAFLCDDCATVHRHHQYLFPTGFDVLPVPRERIPLPPSAAAAVVVDNMPTRTRNSSKKKLVLFRNLSLPAYSAGSGAAAGAASAACSTTAPPTSFSLLHISEAVASVFSEPSVVETLLRTGNANVHRHFPRPPRPRPRPPPPPSPPQNTDQQDDGHGHDQFRRRYVDARVAREAVVDYHIRHMRL